MEASGNFRYYKTCKGAKEMKDINSVSSHIGKYKKRIRNGPISDIQNSKCIGCKNIKNAKLKILL